MRLTRKRQVRASTFLPPTWRAPRGPPRNQGRSPHEAPLTKRVPQRVTQNAPGDPQPPSKRNERKACDAARRSHIFWPIAPRAWERSWLPENVRASLPHRPGSPTPQCGAQRTAENRREPQSLSRAPQNYLRHERPPQGRRPLGILGGAWEAGYEGSRKLLEACVTEGR